ncbi:MAG TPA: asparagine synthase (glutamine-hydrolyzing) [Bacteroidales bacterium]|nr:asparagine synthase (glutamine-hydrolyzing) [Bacteroidales bacterium]
MCGISGIYGYETDPGKRKDTLMNMLSVLQHRGPDGCGYYLAPEVALGQNRLSIVDLATGDQPIVTDKSVIIFNGEIYNYIELKSELEQKGVRFVTTCDTEVLLKAYEYYGESCFEKLNGQFAVLIWNKLTKELIAARDRFGVRPFYMLDFNSKIYFSSELKSFDQVTGYSREYDPKYLFEHCLLWNTLGDHTVFKNIRSLPAGTYRVFSKGRMVRESRYYEIGQSKMPVFKSIREAGEAFKAMLDDSVRLRLRSDVPVGAYLSGGIDSSVVLYLINNHTRNTFKTFSITFEDKEFDESSYQHDMVKHIHSEHHSVNITYEKIDKAFPEAVYHFERPVFRTAPVPLFLLSELVRKNDIKVVLTGEGADEVLFGYDSYKELKLLEFWSRYPESTLRPKLIKKLYPHLSNYSDGNQYGMMKMFYEDFLHEYDNELASLNIRINNNRVMQNYFNGEYRTDFNKENFILRLRKWLPENYPSFNLLQKNQFLEMRTLLSGYLLSSQGDRMSMAHSVEGRYPFLDHRLVDLLFGMSNDYKLKGFNQKFLLKESYKTNIPQSIINRPKRPYMSPDLRSFIVKGKPTDNTAFFLSDELIKDYGIFNPKWVRRFLQKFSDGIPASIGYRDNMIITFILSTQIACYWMRHPRKYVMSDEILKVKINEYESAGEYTSLR